MLGFASGLLFVALCGSSTIYRELPGSLPSAPEAQEVARPPANAAPVDSGAIHSVIGQVADDAAELDVDILVTADGSAELIVQGFGFVPEEQIDVRFLVGDQEIGHFTLPQSLLDLCFRKEFFSQALKA